MSERRRATAQAILQRLLLALPLAAREDGVKIDDLAGDLEVEPRRVLRDLEELKARSYYLPAGLGDQIRLAVTRERLQVDTTGEFQRPVRLTPREALALELALRVATGERGRAADSAATGKTPPPSFEELRERLVEGLRTPPPEGEEGAPQVALGGAEAGDDPVRETLQQSLRRGKQIRLVYRPPGREAAPRRVGPILMAHAEGKWYLIASDLDRKGLRAFRTDRVLEACETGAPFAASDDEEAAAEEFLRDGRIHDGGGSTGAESFQAVVDYSPHIARWIREHGWERTEALEGGGLRVRHEVVDSEWLLRHVLSYGAEAKLVEPEWMQERLAEVVANLARTARRGGSPAV